MNLDRMIEDNNSIKSDISGETCRICMDTVNDPISYCICTGHTSVIHKECLLKWIEISKNYKCEICQSDFNIKKNNKFFWKRIFLISIFTLSVLIYFIYIFFTRNNNTVIYIISFSSALILITSAISSNKEEFYKVCLDIIEYTNNDISQVKNQVSINIYNDVNEEINNSEINNNEINNNENNDTTNLLESSEYNNTSEN